MRILMVSDFYPPVLGGLESYVDELASELVERGHDVHVATLTEGAMPSDPRVSVHPVQSLSSRIVRPESADRPFAPPLPDPVAVLHLGRVLREVAPDVVHVHSWLGASLPRRRPPTVLTLHDYALACSRRTFWRFDDRVCPGPSPAGCVRCSRSTYGNVKGPILAMATAAGRHALRPDVVLALSDHVRRRMSAFVDRPIEVVPGFLRRRPMVAPGSAALAAGPQTAGLQTAGPPTDGARASATLPVGTLPLERFAMFAGDPRSHKGIEALLGAWGYDRPGGLDLVIATSRPIEHLPSTPGVHVCSLGRGQMPAAWAAAEVAIVPSVWEEPFGLVAMEALAAGTPVVGTTAGALPEIVVDGVDGLLVPPGDPSALRVAVHRLGTDRDLRRRMADNASAAAARFDPDVIVPRIESVYRRVGARMEEARR